MRLLRGLLEGTRRGTRIALAVVVAYVLLAAFARWVAPQPVQDLRSLDLMNASLPPAWNHDGNRAFLLGTDEQGRDIVSGVLFGLRLSMGVGFAAVALAMLIGLAAGLVSGYRGGWLDAFLMRAADAQLTFPAILVAMLLDGVARSVLPRSVHETLGIPVVIGAIALAQWVPFARAARVGTLVEREKGYVQAAQVMARPWWSILLSHVLPNVMGPIVVIATIGLGNAILTEATLSFLGVGIPPTSPSLGTLVRTGSAYLPSGAWWMVVFPGLALAGLVLAVNVAGDGLRDGLDTEAAEHRVVSVVLEDLRVSLQKEGGDIPLVQDVSFRIAPGQVLGLVGESGAGKSITAAALIGLVSPPVRITGGQLALRDRAVRLDDARAVRPLRGKEVGFVPQDPFTSLDPLFPVGDQLVETLRAHLPLDRAAARERAIQLLADVGLPSPAERFGHYPHQLSGGMWQRVAIALALSAGPPLVVADECTTALDVSTQAQIVSLLARLVEEHGVSVLLITHDLGVVGELLATEVAIMYAGRIVERAPVGQLLRAPRHPYTRALLDAVPRIGTASGTLLAIPGSMPRPGELPPGCAFHPRCPRASERCRAERPPLESAGNSELACWHPLEGDG